MPETDQYQRHKLREHFLEMFVRATIINSYDSKKDKDIQERFTKDKLENLNEELKKTLVVQASGTEQEHAKGKPPLTMPESQKSQFAPITPSSPQEIRLFQKKFGLIKPKMHPSPNRISLPRYSPIPLPPQTYRSTKLKPGQKIETVNLGKLANLLVDPSIVSIECPGPYKSLLVNRSGSIQTSAMTLTPEEINAIIHSVSEQTRIPITSGVFRAAVQDLIVTAVLSDFVGTRFVIQKRNPFQRY